jgi:hypothetical protein
MTRQDVRQYGGGDWGEPVVRSPGKLISQALQRQGFAPSHEFIVRLIERLRARGLGFSPRRFRREFFAARHYRQEGSRFKPRIAVINGIAVLYHLESGGAGRVALTGILPEYVSVCAEPVPPPPITHRV